ncbi:MAG: hypothetical protein NTZ24_02450, partial [Deltaproteobacteria bacterium]|nr:hypothetical protein [Deltaproteobacteria bacterium]
LGMVLEFGKYSIGTLLEIVIRTALPCVSIAELGYHFKIAKNDVEKRVSRVGNGAGIHLTSGFLRAVDDPIGKT